MKNLKQKITSNEKTIGSWIMTGDSVTTEIMSHQGFDWLAIDLEHSAIDMTKAQHLITIIQASTTKAFVRVSKNEEVVIKKVLDAGADGIIVPMICTAKDAKQAVDYAYYPPFGKRGVGLVRAQKYGEEFNSYTKNLKDTQIVVAQIEHIEGIENLEEIIQVPGIDAVIIGPYDLSASLGYPGEYDRPEVQQALAKYENICQQYNFPMGFHIIKPQKQLLNEKFKSGYTFVAFSIDYIFLQEKIKSELEGIV